MGAVLAALLAGLLATPTDASTCAKGRLATVEMERVLYEVPGSSDFWVHFTVRNRTARPLGVQLEPGWQVFFPNQFGESRVDHREVIDEARLTVSPLDDATRTALREAFRAQKLVPVPVPVHGAVDYYRPFNGGTRAQVDALKGPFLIIAVDGELRVTDGKEVEQLRPSESARDVALRPPVQWRKVPAGAFRIPVR